MPGQFDYAQVFTAVGLAFLLGMLVGSLVRTPVRVFLGLVGVVIGVYWFLSPEEVEGWLRSWAGYLERQVPLWTEWGVRWLAWMLRNPQEAIAYIGGVLLSAGPTYAFWAGLLGRVLV